MLKKKSIILFLVVSFITFMVLDFGELYHFLTHGMFAKRSMYINLVLYLSRYKPMIILRDAMGLWGLLLPFVVIYFMPYYKKMVTEKHIYSIGKDNSIYERNKRLKKKIALINVLIYAINVGMYAFVGLTVSLIFTFADNKPQLPVLYSFDRVNFIILFPYVMLVVYLYTYFLLTVSENTTSNIMLMILFVVIYFLLAYLTVILFKETYSTVSFASVLGLKVSYLSILMSFIYPLVLYLIAKFEKKEIVYK